MQLAAAPYSSLSGSTVMVKTSGGSVVAGPTTVSGSGDFRFTGLPSGANLVLDVTPPAGSSLQSVSIPFNSEDTSPVQFVVAEEPLSYRPPTSIRLVTDLMAPALDQTAEVQAVVSGGSPGLAPSWIAFGNVGLLSAIGPVAEFVPQSPGSATLFAYAGSISASVTLTVPTLPSATTGVTTGATTSGGGPPPPPLLPGEPTGRTGTGATAVGGATTGGATDGGADAGATSGGVGVLTPS